MAENKIPAVIDAPINDMMAGLHSVRTEAEGFRDRLMDIIALAEPKVEAAGLIVIEDAQGVALARDFIKQGREIVKGMEEKMGPVTDAAHKTHKATVAIRNKLIGLVEPAMKDVQDKLDSYYAAERERDERAAQEAESEGRIAPPTIKTAGVSVKHEKIPMIVDTLALIKACINPKSGVGIELIKFDMKAIGKIINNGVDLPGVTYTTETKSKVH